MKYGYKVIRRLSSDALRALCVERAWFTDGDNESYSNMLAKTQKEDVTSDDIVEIASDICEHSDNIRFEDFTDVCNAILLKSFSFMVEQ